MSETYKDAGVDIVKADELVKFLGITGFGSVIRIGNVWIVLSTDGVGTKLLVAEKLEKYDTIGIDLVAMCANDILCHAARPTAFLDYYATGKLNLDKSKDILKGIQEGCKQAGCELVGGETAEMPGLYKDDQFDLAGFCMGIVARKNKNDLYGLPRLDINSGDVILGLPSTGPHSNGYSLIRHLYDKKNREYDKILLTPTAIYSNVFLPALKYIKAAAHITGGGIHGNLPRVLPHDIDYRLNDNVHSTYRNNDAWWRDLHKMSKLSLQEFEGVFNCGWGMIVVVDKNDIDRVYDVIPNAVVLGDTIIKENR